MDIGRGREGARRQSEETVHSSVELGGRGEQAVVASAGLGGDAVGDFPLHHDDGAVDRLVVVEEVQQNLRRYVVGQVADDG